MLFFYHARCPFSEANDLFHFFEALVARSRTRSSPRTRGSEDFYFTGNLRPAEKACRSEIFLIFSRRYLFFAVSLSFKLNRLSREIEAEKQANHTLLDKSHRVQKQHEELLNELKMATRGISEKVIALQIAFGQCSAQLQRDH